MAHESRSNHPRHAAAWLLALAPSMLAAAAHAAPLSATAGYDYSQGATSLTRGVLAAVGVDVANASFAAGGVRWNDELTGNGSSAILTGAVKVHPFVALSSQFTRFMGDDGYRAWRLKLGPQLVLAGSRTLFGYQRDQQDGGAVTQSGVVESEFPLALRWKGRANGSYATTDQGLHGMQGSVGLGFSPISWFEIAGEVGAAQQAALTYGPRSHSLLNLLPGKNGSTTTENVFSPTALVSVRFSAP